MFGKNKKTLKQYLKENNYRPDEVVEVRCERLYAAVKNEVRNLNEQLLKSYVKKKQNNRHIIEME